MINPWRQTEDEGHRSVSQAAGTGRGDLWLVTSISSLSITGALYFSYGNTVLNPVCGLDTGCEKAVKYVWLTLGIFNFGQLWIFFFYAVYGFQCALSQISLCLRHMCFSVLTAEKNDLILNLNLYTSKINGACVLSLQAGSVMQCWHFWLGLVLVPTACLLKDFAWTA